MIREAGKEDLDALLKIKKVFLTKPFVCASIDVKTGIPLFIGTVSRL